MVITQIIGTIAGLLTATCQIPQLIKILRTKQVQGISIVMYVMLSLGTLLWVVHAALNKDIPLLLSSIAILICVMWILIIKLLNKNQ